MEIRSAAKLPKRVRIECGGGRTKQAFKSECDINTIMKKYEKTGVIPQLSNPGEYGIATSTSFHEAMNTVKEAERMFGALPPGLRNRFEGDPARFLDFVGDEDNHAEMMELGLMERPPGEGLPEKEDPDRAAQERRAEDPSGDSAGKRRGGDGDQGKEEGGDKTA